MTNSFEKTFISFGPSCIGADILKSCKRRDCTYGFDWFRSGSIHHKLFFEMSVDEYVDYVVMKPAIYFKQSAKVAETNNKTTHPSRIHQLYGYDMLYNPHRDYNRENRNYFYRAFKRIDDRMTIRKDMQTPYLIMADYVNKEHYIHIESPGEAARYLSNLVLCKYSYIPRIVIFILKIFITTCY